MKAWTIMEKDKPEEKPYTYHQEQIWFKKGTRFEKCSISCIEVPTTDERVTTDTNVELRQAQSPNNSRVTKYSAFFDATNKSL